MINQLAYSARELDDVPLYAVLHIDKLSLFLPQTEIYALESIADVDVRELKRGAIGSYVIDDQHYPVYALDQDLQVQKAYPDLRQECVLLNDGINQYALLSDYLDAAVREQIKLRSLPFRMRKAGTPVHALAVHGGRIGSVTTTAALYNHMMRAIR